MNAVDHLRCTHRFLACAVPAASLCVPYYRYSQKKDTSGQIQQQSQQQHGQAVQGSVCQEGMSTGCMQCNRLSAWQGGPLHSAAHHCASPPLFRSSTKTAY